MAWHIKCTDRSCKEQNWARHIVDLIANHRDPEGWFLCRCGKNGYVEKSFPLQEAGEVWEPFLRGIIPLGDPGETYQPFVFLVASDPLGPADAVWFSYYKDLRATGGRLKLGYGPGGPPVLGMQRVADLIGKLVDLRCLSTGDLQKR